MGRSRGRGRICTLARIIMYARKSALLCTDVGGAYGGRWASDGVRVTRQTTYTPTLLGSEGSAGCPYIMHSAIGPGGWGQRPRREPA